MRRRGERRRGQAEHAAAARRPAVAGRSRRRSGAHLGPHHHRDARLARPGVVVGHGDPLLAGVPDPARRLPVLLALPRCRRGDADGVRARCLRRRHHAAHGGPRLRHHLPRRHRRPGRRSQRRAPVALRRSRHVASPRTRRTQSSSPTATASSGVAGNFPLRTGPVVMARLTEDPARPGSLRLLLPPASPCRSRTASRATPRPSGSTATQRSSSPVSSPAASPTTPSSRGPTCARSCGPPPTCLGIAVVDW